MRLQRRAGTERGRGDDLEAGCGDLPAVRAGRVYVVDGNAYYARPGPRLVDGLEMLGRMIHPDVFGSPFAAGQAYKLVEGETDGFAPFC